MAARIGVGLAVVVASALHPMHTSVTRVSYDARAHTVDVSMRLFTDDFATAVARRTGTAPAPAAAKRDDDAITYARSALAVRDGARGTLALVGCGQRRELDFTWVCLRASLPEEPAQLEVSNRAMHELFDDQVNVVQVVLRGRTKTLVFTRDDGMQRAP